MHGIIHCLAYPSSASAQGADCLKVQMTSRNAAKQQDQIVIQLVHHADIGFRDAQPLGTYEHLGLIGVSKSSTYWTVGLTADKAGLSFTDRHFGLHSCLGFIGNLHHTANLKK